MRSFEMDIYQTARRYILEDSALHIMRIFENRGLTGIFRSEENEETEAWRESRNKEFCNLYPSQNITRVIIARKVM
jgi:ABC-type sulfate transport system substrate-binding protein